MLSVLRIMFTAFAFLAFSGLPALAQTSDAAPPPAASDQGTAATGAEAPADRIDAELQRLRKEVQRLGQAARDKTQQMMSGDQTIVITTDQLAAIAAGAVAGAVLFDLLGGGGLATMTGAVVGGFAGHWIYAQPEQPATHMGNN